jgi:hypothetical protein
LALTVREEHTLRVFEETIWTKERGTKRKIEKIAKSGASQY